MENQPGYGQPPLDTQFRKGRSGNPGGRPGPRRELEKRFQQALGAAMLTDPDAFLERKPVTEIEVLTQALVVCAAAGDTDALRLLYELLPERGRRARVPAAVRRALEQAQRFDAQSQGISAG
jgi:hypothetical protein